MLIKETKNQDFAKLLSIYTYVLGCWVLSTYTESDDKIVIDICWDHVKLSRCIYGGQKFLV